MGELSSEMEAIALPIEQPRATLSDVRTLCAVFGSISILALLAASFAVAAYSYPVSATIAVAGFVSGSAASRFGSRLELRAYSRRSAAFAVLGIVALLFTGPLVLHPLAVWFQCRQAPGACVAR